MRPEYYYQNNYDAYMDAGGTIPRKESVESSREQRQGATHRYMQATYYNNALFLPWIFEN